MKYWDDKFVEERNVYEGEFRSPINTPALKGKILNSVGEIVNEYELEIIKEPCSIQTRLDLEGKKVTDMCVAFEYRTNRTDGIVGTQTITSSLPISEMTQQLQDILINAHLIL